MISRLEKVRCHFCNKKIIELDDVNCDTLKDDLDNDFDISFCNACYEEHYKRVSKC